MAKHCLGRTAICCTVLLLFITSFTSNAQLNPALGTSPWKFANPQPIGFSLLDMSFINDNVGLAIGSSGGIVRTTDGGRNWQGIPYKYVTNTNGVALASFNDVHFVTANVAYAVGSGGVMAKSTDGGINWSAINTPLTPTARNLNALHFINKDTGYIGGASLTSGNSTNINDAPKVYFTRNGGATWDSLVTPFRPQQNNVTLSGFNTAEIHRIHFVNDSVGYVSGSCGSAVPNFSSILWKIDKHVVKDYSIHRTKFGIVTTSYTPATQTFKGVLGINDSLVLISSLNNNVVIRVRTGVNDSTVSALPAVYGAYERGVYEIVVWLNSTATPFPVPLVNNVAGQMQQIKRGPGNKIFITSGNSIIYTTDNGTSWNYTKPHPGTVNYGHWGFTAMDVTPNGRIVIGSFNGLTYDSLPGSPSWQTVYKNARPLFYSFSDMDWADCNNGIVVGSTGTIIKTSDAGRTWENISNPVFEAAGISFSNVRYHAVNSMNLMGGNTIYHSADQGTTNNAIFTEPVSNAQLLSFTMVGQNIAFATGFRFSPAVQRTVIFRSLNANSATPTWDTVKTFPNGSLAPQLRIIRFANADTGYTCGSRGKVYRTIDGGGTWTDISPDTVLHGTTTYTGLSVVNGKNLYIGGNNRKLFKSTDAGATWINLTLVVPATPSPVNSFTSIGNIIMNDVDNGYLHSGGTVLKTTDGWATWTFDIGPGANNIALYPKIPGPIESKKLYLMPLTAGSPVNSTQSAVLIEYGNAALYTVSSTEAVTGASCTNPTGGSITVTAVGGIAPYTYSINGVNFQASNVFNGLAQGTKTITIRDAGCGLITKTVVVGFTDDLTVSASNDTTVCAGAPVQLQATANNASATYSWSPATGLSNAAISNPLATVNSNAAFTVTASLNGCVKTETVNITIKPNPVINAGPDKTIVLGDEVQLNGTAESAVTINWTPATTLTNANTLTPTANPQTTTTYTLSVVNSQNCTSTDQATVTVIPYCVKVMNAFTPNGDGINDLWLVTSGLDCTKQIYVSVYNRYGSLMYKNDNYQNNWDGTYKGKPVADGTYYYSITYKTITGKTVLVSGDVTILR